MEFCGGHTHAISRYGIEDLLPPNVQMVHGPGCPVCVLPMGRIDDAIQLAMRPEVTLCTYADLMRVPCVRRRQPAQGQGGPAQISAWSIRRWTRSASPRRSPAVRSCSSRSASKRRHRRPP
ncbi:MAG: hypothetical protein WDN69_00650 [Aliidongia sp.]